jgi:hypothetical protein
MSRLVQNENLFEEEPLTVYLIPANYSSIGPLVLEKILAIQK